MKILVIIDDLMPGGAERNLMNYLNHVVKSNQVKIITLFPGGTLEPLFENSGISVSCVHLTRSRLLHSIIAACKIIRAYAPDIAVCQRECGRALFPLLLRMLGVRNAILCFDNPNITRNIFSHVLIKLQQSCVKACVVPSENMATLLKDEYAGITSVEVIPNCIDMLTFDRPPRTEVGPKTQIISVGNLRKEKNQSEILKVALELKRRGLDFEVEIVGDGPLGDMLASEIAQKGLRNEVKLMGRRDDVHELLLTSDIFLFTSKSEGFGVAIIEAMAAGLPCVVYDLPVLRELDPHRDCIQVIPQYNTERAVEKIIELSMNTERRRKVGVSSREQCLTHFSSERVAKLWEDFYLRLAARTHA